MDGRWINYILGGRFDEGNLRPMVRQFLPLGLSKNLHTLAFQSNQFDSTTTTTAIAIILDGYLIQCKDIINPHRLSPQIVRVPALVGILLSSLLSRVILSILLLQIPQAIPFKQLFHQVRIGLAGGRDVEIAAEDNSNIHTRSGGIAISIGITIPISITIGSSTVVIESSCIEEYGILNELFDLFELLFLLGTILA